MGDINAGAVFTQSGVPVRGSADYQRVYDSRWRFMEIEIATDFSVVLPAVAPTNTSYYEKTTVIKHGLGFIPAFETDFSETFDDAFPYPVVEVFADKDRIFLRRHIQTNGAIVRNITGNLRIYNVPILETYVAPKGLPQGFSSPQSKAGIKFLDGHTKGVDIEDNSPIGFSVDTTKKILSIHRHGLAKINDFAGYIASVTALDTATNILTVASIVGAPYGGDITWTQRVGQAINYFPGDFVTYPAPLSSSNALAFTIPVDATHCMLAASYQNAVNNVPIDFTTAGSIPSQINAAATPGSKENSILHEVGYPPTFLLAEVNRDEIFFGTAENPDTYIGPLLENPPTRMTADKDYINFFGVQALFSGWYGYIILKDPAELAA